MSSLPTLSPFAFKLSQHQSLFQLVVFSSHLVSKLFELQLHYLFIPKNSQGWFPFRIDWFISLQSRGLSCFFSNTIRNQDTLSTLLEKHIPKVGSKTVSEWPYKAYSVVDFQGVCGTIHLSHRYRNLLSRTDLQLKPRVGWTLENSKYLCQ